jgi:hypothetical protein
VDILARFAGFFRSLRNSPSHEVAVMANLASRDIRSTTGKNLKLLEEITGLDPWVYGSDRVKQELVKAEKVEVPQLDQWRVGYLASLLEQRQRLHYWGDKEGWERVSGLIDSLCIN